MHCVSQEISALPLCLKGWAILINKSSCISFHLSWIFLKRPKWHERQMWPQLKRQTLITGILSTLGLQMTLLSKTVVANFHDLLTLRNFIWCHILFHIYWVYCQRGSRKSDFTLSAEFKSDGLGEAQKVSVNACSN